MEIGPEDGSESVDFGLENGVRKGPSSCGRRRRRRRRAVYRSGEKRKMCVDKALKVRVKKRTFSKLKQLKSSALSFSALLVCKLDERGSELVLCSLVLWKSFGLLWWMCVQTARYKSNLSKCSVIGAMYSQEGNTDGAYTQVLSLLYSL
jgi:hypothetical protein